MAYRFQLQDARNSIAFKNISGVCTDTPQFSELLNEATRRLMKRGDFFGTVQTMNLVFQGCIVAWPREVGTIIGVRRGAGVMHLSNSWYSFTGSWRQHINAWHSDTTFEDLFPAPTYNDIYNSGNGMLIRYYVVNSADLGKKITLFGKQFGQQPLQEKDADGNTIMGQTLTATTPYASTANKVVEINSIVREETQGMAYLYQYDPVSNSLIDLAVFQPGETHPRYRRTIIRNFGMRFCCLGQGQDPTKPVFHNIEALVKLNFIPVKNDRDFLMIDDFDALKFMIMAIKMEEANDQEGAEILITKAIRELNFDDRDKEPNNQTPVFVNAIQGGVIKGAW